ncbi:MAG TPA: porin, partial [Tepidisphaeraceae bacterium]|nr:porin [Tepidisphaeraceae bacterium]
MADFRDDANEDDGDNSDDIENGFETRRMKLSLEGTAFSPDLTYKFQWRTNTDGGDVTLEDAWARYMFSDDWGFRLGQFKDPVFHEELTSSKYQLAADRSMVNSILGIGEAAYTEGATLIYGGYNKNNPLNVEVGLTNGVGQD